MLFNLNNVLEHPEPRRVIVVEGFFDAMKVNQAGFPAVIALMGSTLSDAQAALLLKNCEAVTIMLDGDEAGQTATAQIVARLVRETYVKVAAITSGQQPDQLSSGAAKYLSQITLNTQPRGKCHGAFFVSLRPFLQGNQTGR